MDGWVCRQLAEIESLQAVAFQGSVAVLFRVWGVGVLGFRVACWGSTGSMYL